ncbi:DUF4347 domain-containing protein, partial [Gluconacetobacter aggeris]
MRLILEQRYLFDGSIAHVAHRHARHDGLDTHTGTAVADAMETVTDAPPAAGAPRHDPGHPDERQAPTLADGANAAAGSLNAIVFVDSRVTDWKELTASLPDTVGVVVISPDSNGMDVVSRVLAHQQDLRSVSFLTYGQPGQAELGSSTISAATVQVDARQVTAWGDALAPGGQILFWGCDVGQGADGQALVDDLHTLTGADIAASTDRTGLATLGGDWTLERTAGISSAQVASPFTAQAQADYAHVLDTLPVANVTLAKQASAMLGSTFTDTITFSNTGNATGYSPYVQIFAPTNSKQYTPLQSLQVQGAPAALTTVQSVALTLGTDSHVGATNPLTGQWVDAPSGLAVGDTMYVAALPFGSYTVGQPAVTVLATFGTESSDGTTTVSQLSSAPGGAPVDIYASGGYALGSSPTGNGAIAGAPNQASGSTSVDLLDVTSQIITPVGEGEDPTGSAWPDTYRVTVTPAPAATSANPIVQATVTIQLPDTVIYKGASSLSFTDGTGTPDATALSGQPGGKVTLNLSNVSYTGTPIAVDIPVYVPRNDATGNPILSADVGGVVNPVTIDAPITGYTAGTWTAPAGSVDHGQTENFSGTIASTGNIFAAKAFAIQDSASSTSDGTAGFMPGDTITHTISVENSNYYESNIQQITGTLSDGQLIDGNTHPQFTYTGTDNQSHTVDLGANPDGSTGTNPYFHYTYDATTGTTSMTFDVGAAMAAGGPLPPMQAGTRGTLTYDTVAQQNFAKTGQPVTEGDILASNVSATAQLLDLSGNALGQTATDDSHTSLAVPQGTPGLTIVAINGDTNAAGDPIRAGDTVTYEATYNLKAGTFQGLGLSSYLPLPLFDVAQPTASGSPSSFSLQTGGTASTLAAGQYSLESAPGSVGIQSMSVDSTANGVTFKMDNGTTYIANGGTVKILFAVKATDTPFANGLTMTSQEQSNFTNGESQTTANSLIVQSTVGSPQAELKTGIVSVVNNANGNTTDSNVAYTVQDGSLPTSSSTGGLVQSDDQNVSNVQGNETARVSTTIANTGDGGMYNLTVKGTLPTGVSAASISSITITPSDSRSPVTITNASLIADYFGSGLNLATQTSLGAAETGKTGEVLAGATVSGSTVTGIDSLAITYDLALPASTNPGSTLTAGAQVLSYSNTNNTDASNFITSSGSTATQLGGSATGGDINDSATIATQNPGISQVISKSRINDSSGSSQTDYHGTDEASATANVEGTSGANNTVVPGEQRDTTISVTVPQGTISNAGQPVTVTVDLPKGVTYANGTATMVSAGGTGAVLQPVGTPTSDGNGGTILTFDLGSSVTNSAAGPATIQLKYTANYTPDLADGTTVNLSATLHYTQDGSTSTTLSAANLPVIDHVPSLSESITETGAIYSGAPVTFTATITNNGKVPAYNVTVAPTTANMTVTGYKYNGTTYATIAAMQSAIDAAISSTGLAANGSLSYDIIGTVNPNLAAGTSVSASDSGTFKSVPSNNPIDPSTVYSGNFTGTNTLPVVAGIKATMQIVGEQAGTDASHPSDGNPRTSVNVVPGDQVTLRGIAQLPEGSNGTVKLTFSVPYNLDVVDYANSVKIMLASPDQQLSVENLVASPPGGLQQLTTSSGGIPSGFASVTLAQALQAGNYTYTPGTSASPGTLTLTLGTVSDNPTTTQSASNGTNTYVIVDIPAYVANTAANTDNIPFSEHLTVAANGSASAATSANVTETVQEPKIALTKDIQSIAYNADGSATVTYTDTLKNIGDATAYNVSLNDLLAGGGNETYTGTVTNVDGTGATVKTAPAEGSGALTGTFTLAHGATETITYTVRLANQKLGAPESTATVTWQSLDISGSTGGVDQSRDGSGSTANGTLNNYVASVTTGLAAISGNVWQTLGNDPAHFSSPDTELSGVAIALTASTKDSASPYTQTVQTGTDGSYTALMPIYQTNGTLNPPASLATIAAPTITASTPAQTGGQTVTSDTLEYNDGNTGAAARATITVTADSGDTTHLTATNVNMSFAASDTPPVLTAGAGTSWASPTPISGNNTGAPVLVGGAVTVADTQLDTLGNYGGTVLTIQSSNGSGAFSLQNGSSVTLGSGTQLMRGGTLIGSYTNSGTLTLTFNGNATAADVQAVLQNLQYSSSLALPGNAGTSKLAITATLNDGNANLPGYDTGPQGTGTDIAHTQSNTLTAYIDIPPGSGFTSTFIEPNDSSTANSSIGGDSGASAGKVTVDSALTLGGSGTISQATITINPTDFKTGEDQLTGPANGTAGDIASSYDATTGVLTLTSASGASMSTWQTALRNVSYYNTSNEPTIGTRGITIALTENGNATPVTTTGSVTVVASDDSPVLDTTVPVSLASGSETEAMNTPSGQPSATAGTLVSDLVGFKNGSSGPGNVIDPDGKNQTGGTAGASLPGIAIIGALTNAGQPDGTSTAPVGIWWYTTDGGTTWTQFPTSPSASNALHLVADSQTRVYFQPTEANWNGTINNALTFRAWDQSDGTANGTVSALPSGLGTGNATNAGISPAGAAYSSAVDTLNLTVAAVNDAPTNNGMASVSMPTVPVNSTGPGQTVGALFGNAFSDTADQQHSSNNLTGSVANTLAGVAITNDAATASQGAWQYSTDGGATWTAVPTTVSATSALVLPTSATLRFVSAPGYFGPVGSLTAHAIDSSGSSDNALPFRDQNGNPVFGSDVAAGRAYTNADVSTAGGASPVSADTTALTIAVSDAPTSGTPQMAAETEDTSTPPSDTVGSLFTPVLSDPTRPGAAVAGVAITANTANAATQGVWQYSTDGGSTWAPVPTTGLSDASALVLPQGAKLEFLPVANFNGQPGGLTTRVIDNTGAADGVTPLYENAGTPVYGADLATATAAQTVDLTAASQGSSSVGSNSVNLTIPVTPVNDAPIASPAPAFLPSVEDQPAEPAQSVGSLFGSHFSDTADQQKSAGNATGSTANTLAGIAITADAADPATQGAWQYSVDGGTHWVAVPADVSSTHALVLSSGALLRFEPVANYNGVPGGLTAKLIENSGQNGGADGAPPLYTDPTTSQPVYGYDLGRAPASPTTATPAIAQAGVDVSSAGGTTSLSLASVPLGTIVTPTNDAPVMTGAPQALSEVEDPTQPPPNNTVSSLFQPVFSDAADASNLSTANSLAGIALTGDAADAATQGVWQYSVNGSPWTTIPAGSLSDTSALVLPGTARLQFVPVANYNGQPGGLTAHVIDDSTAAQGALPAFADSNGNAVYGADVAGATSAYVGVDVSAAVNGGDGTAPDDRTSVSAGSQVLNVTVVAVNDAPTVSGTTIIMPTETNSTPAGADVRSLFTPIFSDAADAQHSPSDPTGSTANTLAGVVVTGDAATASQGVWQYSTDGGRSWTAVPADVSPNNALILSAGAQLQFVASGTFTGTPGALTAHVIDSSDAASGAPPLSGSGGSALHGSTLAAYPTGGDVSPTNPAFALSGVDVSAATGASTPLAPIDTNAISAQGVQLIVPVHDAPVMTAPPAALTEPEDSTHGNAATTTVEAVLNQPGVFGIPAGGTNGAAGIAITGDAADAATQGTWYYSTDSGQTWTAITATASPGGVSGGNALVLSGGAELQFVPVANYNGQPGGLTMQVIDSSNAAQGAAPLYTDPTTGNPVYGADLANATNPI